MKRVLTALLLVPFGLYASVFAPWQIFLACVVLAAVLSFAEYARITDSFAPLGYAAGLLILVAPPRESVLVMILLVPAAMCLPVWTHVELEVGIRRSASLVLGTLYVFGAWKTGILIHDSNPVPGLFGIAAGHHWLLFGMVVNWLGDTGAYYVGRAVGRHKMAPEVSPGKTWEGAAASAVTGLLFGAVWLPFAIPGTGFATAALFGVAANAAGQLGDLAESAIKRGVGVKDSGNLLPGHGGMLDRMDSTLFSLPVLYALLIATGRAG